jgi:hypothetical protein
MNLLVGMEESQEICKAFRNRGHIAFSCDLQPCSGGHPEWHIQCNLFDIIDDPKWDMGIFHPVCTYLTVSNNNAMANGCSKYTAEQGRQYRKEAIADFMKIVNCNIPKYAIENPIGIMSTEYKQPRQIIQPYNFGHGETKATCLWLRRLPRLNGFNVVPERVGRIWKMSPGPDRTKERSKTFPGIAYEMARQWG